MKQLCLLNYINRPKWRQVSKYGGISQQSVTWHLIGLQIQEEYNTFYGLLQKETTEDILTNEKYGYNFPYIKKPNKVDAQLRYDLYNKAHNLLLNNNFAMGPDPAVELPIILRVIV